MEVGGYVLFRWEQRHLNNPQVQAMQVRVPAGIEPCGHVDQTVQVRFPQGYGPERGRTDVGIEENHTCEKLGKPTTGGRARLASQEVQTGCHANSDETGELVH